MKKVVVTILSAALLLAQDPQGSTALDSKSPTKFSVTTQLVIVGLTAKDRAGKSIPGLQIGDFIVSEDGKRQKLVSCDYQQLDNTPLAALADGPAEIETKAAPAPVAAASRPGELKYKDRRLLVLYFDMTAM